MAFTSSQQNIWFTIVMTLLTIVLFFAYKLQFQMQRTVSYYDNYEKFDCGLFHDSLSSKEFFVAEDVKDAKLDQDVF